ncbi:helix-turn-helix transcriptional regulator [Paenibacillus senegalensis]|uniref:helix-turn-helix transcriptional regulator n=1 Tax=Paenibacillus senegalensis TaxID=1465766 RepID=UPI00028816DC|nr:helix-turn-helix transcriptional regulator [Paenibacillus senegalensis]
MMFYDKLRKLRKQQGFTIREVADRSGVSPSYISQLENGQRGIPSPEVLHKLSAGLNTSYAVLMQEAGYLQPLTDMEPPPQVPINLRRFIRENELEYDGLHLTAEDKEWIDRVLTALFWKVKKEQKPTNQP